MTLRPEDSPGFLMWHATLLWQRHIAAALAPFGLTHVQFVLLASLWWLEREDHRPNQIELARHAGVDVKMASQVVRRLEGKNLLARVVDVDDSRARRLCATAEGSRVAAEAIDAVEAADREFFAPVADRDQLLAVLRRLAHPT
ncbi:MAG: MarR family winged helix-turn-helix transcriptional regulator [Stackebrandtia sp.]